MTDLDLAEADLDAPDPSDHIAEAIGRLFEGRRTEDCVLAMAAVLGRIVAHDRRTSPGHQFAAFVDAAVLEMEFRRSMN